ncbi:precorrin-6A reductase [Cloacibacillus sp. An23]|uniref:precorrin-6A reductase n=1 Tax=Cloacibacillus sp. An23 TaxID=1965591 RepID=UPI000B38DB5E|nr:precorrin-6A reductase [Cloacibacillus sp. An23]OUO94439.1 precorrin-6A reductase [Cloacibacillus sp. An23]
MKEKLLLFGGTTEAREIAESGLPMICCVATEYGAEVLHDAPGLDVRTGRMDAAEMASLMRAEKITVAADATHPYARAVTAEIKKACAETGADYMRIARERTPLPGDAVVVESCAEAAKLLDKCEERALIATGSKELDVFTKVHDYRERLFPRVLPSKEVIERCASLGFGPGQIIAMRGPFSKTMNAELLRMTGATVLVTKDGGAAGGMPEKIEAACETGARLIVVGRADEEGYTAREALLLLRRRLGAPRPPLFPMLTDIEKRKAVIAGGGAVALRRARTLAKCGAEVHIVAPDFAGGFDGEGFIFHRKKWETSDGAGAFIIIAATDDRALNAQIGAEAKAAGVHVSVADAAEECSFYFPSLVTEGETAVSVSAGALSPRLTRRLAGRLREVWPAWVAEEKSKLEEEGSK